jgi:hypothetical protein
LIECDSAAHGFLGSREDVGFLRKLQVIFLDRSALGGHDRPNVGELADEVDSYQHN